MSSTLKKVILVGAGGTMAGVAYVIWNYFNSSGPSDGEFGGSFDKVFKNAIEASKNTNFNEKREAGSGYKFSRYGPPAQDETIVPIMILFGTEYGFSAELSRKLEDEITKLGPIVNENNQMKKIYPRVVSMEDFEALEWEKEQTILVITSTYGDGVPPTRARACFDYITAPERKGELDLSHINYSVLALGDKGYPHFCRAGKTFDARMEELGAIRIHPRMEVDLEDWDVINTWFSGVIEKLPTLPHEPCKDYLWEKVSSGQLATKAVKFDRQRPYYSKLVEKRILTRLHDGDDKETWHFELELPEDLEGMKFTVGDSLGVLAVNCSTEVQLILKKFSKINAEEYLVKVPAWKHQDQTNENPDKVSLKLALSHYYDLKNAKPRLLQLLQRLSEQQNKPEYKSKIDELLKDGTSSSNEKMNTYFKGHEVVDVLNDFPQLTYTPEELLDSLGQLLPRYYSISSSLVHDNRRVTITVAIVRYPMLGRPRKGVCSTYLSDRINIGDVIPIFINNNPDFRLPEDQSRPIIMVGPGTGIAPFRAMIQERVKSNSTGKNVLYFGCRFADRDFLYRDELEQAQNNGNLVLHTAFSRAQKEKIYVQHRIKETGESIWKLLEEGAHFYICGDAQYMAGDVQKALSEIIVTYGNLDQEGAQKYIENLENTKRFQKDVWY